MNITKITALAGTAAMALAGILGTTAASAAQAASASRKPVVEAVNHNPGTMSPYRHGRFYLADGPTFWLSHPRFFKWNGTEARATGALWGSDSGVFSLGHHVTLVFYRVRHHRFTELSILRSHGINTHWHLVFSDHSWFGGR